MKPSTPAPASSIVRLATLSATVLLALFVVVSSVRAEDAPQPDAPKPEGPKPEAPQPGTPPAPTPGGAGPRVDRKLMWPAPTAEDWKKPCLITWQRTWEDAQTVSRETGKPILVCINMDGEVASEHYAGVRYRQPEIAALYEPYVTVIASVYRHTPSDYDEQGHRVLCPRFGTVTCGEHIAMESVVYDKYEKGQRVAPRHIGVELDGKEMYDVFYRNDTASVFQDIRDGIAKRTATPPTVVRGDRPVVERVDSRDVGDRTAVEAAYQAGDKDLRKVLLDAALKHGDAAPIDLLRLAVFGFDPDLARLARAALAETKAPDATDVIVEALRVPMEPAERDALIAALSRLGAASPRARWLAVVQQGLSGSSSAVDTKGWPAREGGKTFEPVLGPDPDGLEARLSSSEQAARTRPEDPATRLDYAETSLALAVETPRSLASDPKRARVLSRALYSDARRFALEAEKLGAKGYRVDAVIALAAYYGGDTAEGYARAEAAVKAMPPGDRAWTSMAVTTVFAESRWKAIKKAVREKKEWPPSWLADVNAAYTILLRHPLGTETQVTWHYDFLDWLEARDQAKRVLEEGLGRFPDSEILHLKMRERVMRQKGPDGLEAAYAALMKSPDAPPALAWHAAKASLAAADAHRRAAKWEAAQAAYGRALALLEKAAASRAPGTSSPVEDSIEEAMALALSARARVTFMRGDDAGALEDLLASFKRRPEAAGTQDGVGMTPGETAAVLLARLRETKKDELAARLEAALATLDPELIRPERE